MSDTILLLNLPSFSSKCYSKEIMGGFGLEVGHSLRYPPIPLAIGAAILEQAGRKVCLIDADALEYKKSDILELIQKKDMKIIGILSSSRFWN